MRHVVRLLVVTLVVVATGVRPAAAADGERITRYSVTLLVQPSGAIEARETIVYDFGDAQRHGIYRTIPIRTRFDDKKDRVIDISGLRVTSPDAAPTNVNIATGTVEEIRIGDPDRLVTGVHTYVLSYTVTGALTAFADHVELVWNAIGADWNVPISDATVDVDVPEAVMNGACYAGEATSRLGCDRTERDASRLRFGQASLSPREGLTVVVGLPTGSVVVPPPVLRERWSVDRAFARTPATAGGLAAALLVVFGGLGLLVWRRGRDRRFVGSPVDAALGNESGAEQVAPLFTRDTIPVEFEPPDGIRPGQVGTLLDEKANPLDVTATIVDLGARGYLTIAEVPGHGVFKRTDWELTKGAARRDALVDYEAMLFDALFAGRETVRVSDLRYKFASTLRDVERELYNDLVQRRWYLRRPDNVRFLWRAVGISLVVLGVVVTAVVASHTHAALPTLAIPIAGLALVVCARWMPARTARGNALRRRALGFREYMARAETDRSRFAEQEELFTSYLGYAVVFGITGKWAKAFAGLDDTVPQPGFFVGPHPFTVSSFESSMHSFTTMTIGTIGAHASGGGAGGVGGFVGGGLGGGGGGSW